MWATRQDVVQNVARKVVAIGIMSLITLITPLPHYPNTSPGLMGPFSALTFVGTMPTIAIGTSVVLKALSVFWRLPTTPGLVE
jgi:hypothetical protein